jgi:hypothetical protein
MASLTTYKSVQIVTPTPTGDGGAALNANFTALADADAALAASISTISLTPGPAGTTGAQGPQGEQGPKGDKGDTGAQGIQGIQGPIGLTGATGAKGDTGATGLTGPKGDKGDTGATGLTGAAGTPAADNWGSITGTLSNQTDLQTALNGKDNAGAANTVGVSLTNHVNNNLNPHSTTAAQVGTYTAQQIDGQMASKATGNQTVNTNSHVSFATVMSTQSIATPSVQPITDSTSGFRITKSDGTTPVINVDTINSKVAIGTANVPQNALEVWGKGMSIFGSIQMVAGVTGLYFGWDGTASTIQSTNYGNAGKPLTIFGVPTLLKDANSGQEMIRCHSNGNVGIAGVSVPSARLQIVAGTTAAGTAPFKLTTSGSALMTTPEAGAIETDGTDLYWTNAAGTRKKITLT